VGENMIETICGCLRSSGTAYKALADGIEIPLPNNFGNLIICVEDGELLIGLKDHSWHTHGDILAEEWGIPQEQAVVLFVSRILEGKEYLVEEREEGRTVRKYITDDRSAVFKYKTPGIDILIYPE